MGWDGSILQKSTINTICFLRTVERQHDEAFFPTNHPLITLHAIVRPPFNMHSKGLSQSIEVYSRSCNERFWQAVATCE